MKLTSSNKLAQLFTNERGYLSAIYLSIYCDIFNEVKPVDKLWSVQGQTTFHRSHFVMNYKKTFCNYWTSFNFYKCSYATLKILFKYSCHSHKVPLQLKSIHPLWKILEKCTKGGVWIFKYTYLLCDCIIMFITEGVIILFRNPK